MLVGDAILQYKLKSFPTMGCISESTNYHSYFYNADNLLFLVQSAILKWHQAVVNSCCKYLNVKQKNKKQIRLK